MTWRNSSGKTAIEGEAEFLLLSYGISHPIQIDLEAIAWDEGVRVRYGNLDGCEARIIGNAEQAVVRIDSRVVQTRARFSLGHELGHWRFDRGKVLTCEKRSIGYAIGGGREQRANIYAASLLMPRFLLEPLCLGRRLDFDLVDELKQKDLFHVSREAMAYRLIDTWKQPAMLVVYDMRGVRKWFKSSSRVPKSLRAFQELQQGSILMNLLQTGSRSGIGLVPSAAWFSGEYESETVFESSLSFGEYGCLSLLSWR